MREAFVEKPTQPIIVTIKTTTTSGITTTNNSNGPVPTSDGYYQSLRGFDSSVSFFNSGLGD